GDDAGDVLRQQRVDELACEAAPRTRGLDTADGPEAVRGRGAVQGRLGPFEVASALSVRAHCGARVLVVEEELRVDRRDFSAGRRLAEPRNRLGRGLAGVVPAVERDDRDSRAERLLNA